MDCLLPLCVFPQSFLSQNSLYPKRLDDYRPIVLTCIIWCWLSWRTQQRSQQRSESSWLTRGICQTPLITPRTLLLNFQCVQTTQQSSASSKTVNSWSFGKIPKLWSGSLSIQQRGQWTFGCNSHHFPPLPHWTGLWWLWRSWESETLRNWWGNPMLNILPKMPSKGFDSGRNPVSTTGAVGPTIRTRACFHHLSVVWLFNQ